MDEWWTVSVAYSMLKALSAGKFTTWTFDPLASDGTLKVEGNQFHLCYPVGTFERPCIGIEVLSSVAGGKGGVGVGEFNESFSFAVYVLGTDGDYLNVQLWSGFVRQALRGVRVPFYQYMVAAGAFVAVGGKVPELHYLDSKFKSIRSGSDKPESELRFWVQG